MTELIRNTWVNYFQCKQASQLLDLNNSVSYGICAKAKVKKNNILMSLINVISSYRVFEEEVIYAIAIEVTKEEIIEEGEVEVILDNGTVTSFIGNGTTKEEILLELQESFELNGYETLIKDNFLYVWSYDEEITSTTIGNNDYATGVFVSILDDLDRILDEWNCLTWDELCNIINFTKKYINTKCNCK